MKVLLLALGFMVVFEGIFPLVAPGLWQRAVVEIAKQPPETIRRAAMVMVVVGLAFVWLLMTYF